MQRWTNQDFRQITHFSIISRLWKKRQWEISIFSMPNFIQTVFQVKTTTKPLLVGRCSKICKTCKAGFSDSLSNLIVKLWLVAIFYFYTFSQYLVHSFVQRNCRFSQRKQLDLSHNWPISPLSLHRIFFNWMSKRRDNALVTHFSTQGDAGVDGTVGPPGPQVSQSTKPLIVWTTCYFLQSAPCPCTPCYAAKCNNWRKM